MLRAVDMRAELHSFFLHLTDVRQREDLKSTAVGQNRVMPAVKLMQAAALMQHVQAGTQVEMICVTQYYLGFYLIFQVPDMRGFYASHRANRHENRGLDVTVVSCQDTSARIAFCIVFD